MCTWLLMVCSPRRIWSEHLEYILACLLPWIGFSVYGAALGGDSSWRRWLGERRCSNILLGFELFSTFLYWNYYKINHCVQFMKVGNIIWENLYFIVLVNIWDSIVHTFSALQSTIIHLFFYQKVYNNSKSNLQIIS